MVISIPKSPPRRDSPEETQLVYTLLGIFSLILTRSFLNLTTFSSFPAIVELHAVKMEPALQNSLPVVGLVMLGNYLLAGEKIISLNRVYAKMIQNGLQGQVSKL